MNVYFRSQFILFHGRLNLFERDLTIERVVAVIPGLFGTLLSIGESAASTSVASTVFSVSTRFYPFNLHDVVRLLALYLLAGRPRDLLQIVG